MTKKHPKKHIRNPQQPSFFTNEEQGLPPDDYEYRIVTRTDADGRRVSQRIPVRTKDSFVRAAREVWGDRNDYSESVLTGMKEPITIRCRKHDHYYTVPMAQNHIAKPRPGFVPTGCPLCASELAGYETNRGPHHFRTPEERERDEQEKARRRAEREAKHEQRKAENLEELRRQRAIERYCRKGPDLVLTAPNAKRQPLTAREFYRRVSGRYGSKLTFQRKRKLTMQTKITATCYRHGAITHDAAWWLSGKGCEYCNGKVYYPHWKDYARQVHGDKYEYVGEAPTTGADLIHYICPIHGLQEQRFDVHVSQGCGCKYCANRHIPLEDRIQNFISQCVEKYGPGRFDYSRVHEDYVNNDTPVWIRCCLHDKWFQTTPDNNLRTVHGSCPVCSVEYTESQGEAEIKRWLLKHGITDFEFDEHIIHHNNPRCKRQYLRPDFWFNNRPLVIEYHGEQHYRYVNIFNDEDWTFEDQQIRDATLRDWCRRHRRRLLEIPYWEFKNVPSILQSVLIDGGDIPTFEPPSDNTESTTKAPTDA